MPRHISLSPARELARRHAVNVLFSGAVYAVSDESANGIARTYIVHAAGGTGTLPSGAMFGMRMLEMTSGFLKGLRRVVKVAANGNAFSVSDDQPGQSYLSELKGGDRFVIHESIVGGQFWIANKALAIASLSDVYSNPGMPGLTIVVNVTSSIGVFTFTPVVSIEEPDAAGAPSSVKRTLWQASAGISADGTYIYQLHPGPVTGSGEQLTEQGGIAVPGGSIHVNLVYAGAGVGNSATVRAFYSVHN